MHGRMLRPVFVVPILVALAVTLTASRPAAVGAETPALKSISSRLDGTVSTVLIESSEPVAYRTSQPDPLTVLVDLRNVNAAALDGKPAAGMLAPVTGVAVETATAPDGSPVARVRLHLDRAVTPRVRSSRNTILVELDRTSATGATAALGASAFLKAPSAVKAEANPPALRPAAPAAENRSATSPAAGVSGVERRAAATQLRSVRYAKVENGYSVTLSGNGPLTAANVDEAKDLPPRVLLDFRGVASGSAPAVTNVKNEDIDKVRVATNSHDPLVTRVVIDLARKLPFTVEQVGDDLRVMFSRAVASVASVASAAGATSAASAHEPVTPVELPEEKPVVVANEERLAASPVVAATVAPSALAAPVAPTSVTPVAAVPPVAPAPPVAAAARIAPVAQVAPTTVIAPERISQTPLPVPMPASLVAATMQAPNSLQQNQNTNGQRQFSGDPVTLDFQGADLRAVLRTFAEISNGLNIVIDPSIQGTVDVSLHDVPWDQALDIILRANKLGYTVDGNIVRIVPLTVLATEQEERRKLTEAQALAGELRTVTVPVSYAKAADLVPVITRSTLSARGDVQVDARTNTLIIRDLGDRLQSASDLVLKLDRPQPQVEIEARIVQLNRNSARELGIQWGFNGKVDPSVGTSTGLAFPSSGNLAAGTGGVNNAAPSAVSLALGSINGAMNLDVTLRALESVGKGRILSTPRVATQNNVEAEITQGSQIPIQVVSNNTVTVQFKDAALTLRVTPQITASNTVIMRIFVEKAAPNYTQTTPAQPIPSIDTQRAVTTVLMDDGETTVIGGIYTRQENEVEDRTPFLHRVPLLGWLFKTESRLDNSDELLIFITPRIAK